MAYTAERSGENQVYVTRFPDTGRRWQVFSAGGEDPFWHPAGDRLYYRQDHTIMEVSVEPGDVPRLGRATTLFELARFDQNRGYFLAGDDRFIVVVPAGDEDEDAARSGIKVVQSWFREFE